TSRDSPPRVRMMSGSSDQGGWSRNNWNKSLMCGSSKDSSVRTRAPAPAEISRQVCSAPAQADDSNPLAASMHPMARTSGSAGARTRTRFSVSDACIAMFQDFLGTATKYRCIGQHALEFRQRLAHANPATGLQLKFANGFLVAAAALFEHGDGLLHFPNRFKEPESHHRVGQVAQFNGRLRHRGESLLGHDQDCDDAKLIKVDAQFVQLIGKVFLTRHRIEIAVQAVDNHQLAAGFDSGADAPHEFPGRN